MKHTVTKLILFPLLTLSSAWAQPENLEPLEDSEIEAISARYAVEFRKLEERGASIASDSPSGPENATGIDVDPSKWHDMSFDVPEFRMKRIRVAFDIPTLTMKSRRIVWHMPEVTMATRKVGQHPTTRGFRIVWKDILVSVPVTKMARKEAKLDLPELRMSRHDISFDSPEIFRMRRVKVRVPEVNVRTTASIQKRMESASREIEASGTHLAAAQKKEIEAVAARRLRDEMSLLADTECEVMEEMRLSIEKVRKAGANPEAIPGEDGTSINLIEKMEVTQKQFVSGNEQLRVALAALERTD